MKEVCPLTDYSNIGHERRNIRIRKIVVDDFISSIVSVSKINVNHRPLDENRVKSMMNVPFDMSRDVVVIWSSKDKKYHIVDGKHHFTKFLMKDKPDKNDRYPCMVSIRKDSGEKLDKENHDDAKIANSISLSLNTNVRRACNLFLILKVFELGFDYNLRTNRKRGMYPYILNELKALGITYDKETIKKHYRRGRDLNKYCMVDEALGNLSKFATVGLIDEEIRKAKKDGNKRRKTYSVNLRFDGLDGATAGLIGSYKKRPEELAKLIMLHGNAS
jgi:hypothetical protein